MAGLWRRLQAVRVHVEIGEGRRERGPETELFPAANVQRRVTVLFDGNQTGFIGRAVRVAQIVVHVNDAHKSK